jgi:hypothetical protein
LFFLGTSLPIISKTIASCDGTKSTTEEKHERHLDKEAGTTLRTLISRDLKTNIYICYLHMYINIIWIVGYAKFTIASYQ